MSFLPLAKDVKDPRSTFDLDLLDMKLTNAEPYREVTPFDEDMTDDYKEAAYEHHDTLIKLGGRPTRPVRETPAGNAVYKKEEGLIYIYDEHGKSECTLAYDMSPIHYHWTQESSRFEEELDRWKEFQAYERRNPQLSPLKTAFDLRDIDQSLEAILTKLNKWQEFEAYHQSKVNTALMSKWHNRQALERAFQKEAGSDHAASNREIQSELRTWLDRLYTKQRDLEASQEQLTRIQDQAFEMLSEAGVSLLGTPLLCQRLEQKVEEQTNATYQELELLEARPSHSIQPPPLNASYNQRLLHRKSETSRLDKERREWRIFLKWRKHHANASTSASVEDQQPKEHHLNSTLWFDYVKYQEQELDKARSWVVCWQRKLRREEEYVEYLTKAGLPTTGLAAKYAREYVNTFQKDVAIAEAQLRSAQQQLTELSLNQTPSATHEITQQSTKCEQLTPNLSASYASRSSFDGQELLQLRISPTKGHQTPPTCDTSSPIHPSCIPNPIGNQRANNGNTSTGHSVAMSDAAVPDQVIAGDGTQTIDAPETLYPGEAIEEGEAVQDVDTIMTDLEDSVKISSLPASEIDSKGRGTLVSPVPIHQVAPTLKQDRFATKLNRVVSSKVPKNINKKPVKEAKAYTEKQATALLNAASTSCPPTDLSPLRRSERSKEKAAVPADLSPPQSTAFEPISNVEAKEAQIAAQYRPILPTVTAEGVQDTT